MNKITRGVLWSDPTADRNEGQIESLDKEDHNQIAKDLSEKIADMIGNNYQDKQVIAKLIQSAIKDQIRQYLREYDNVVAEAILNSLKNQHLGEIKGWMSEIDFEYARHGKLSTFGRELKEEFDRLKKENQLEKIKKRIMGLNPITSTMCENNDGQVWLSNVLTIIDQEMGIKEKPTLPEETDKAG